MCVRARACVMYVLNIFIPHQSLVIITYSYTNEDRQQNSVCIFNYIIPTHNFKISKQKQRSWAIKETIKNFKKCTKPKEYSSNLASNIDFNYYADTE